MDYFEILGFSIEELQGQDENTIRKCVNEAYKKQFSQVNTGLHPLLKEKTREKCQELLLDAKDTLIEPKTREKHIADLTEPSPPPPPPHLSVKILDLNIGSPVPKTSPSINFGKIDIETQKTIRLKIENDGLGFLEGDIRLVEEMPGLQISSTQIRGSAVVTVELDASSLTAKQTHKTALIIDTNGGELRVPISCYVDYPIQKPVRRVKSVRRVVTSGISMSGIALVARLIVIQPSWLMSNQFVNLDVNWVKWFEWPLIDQIVYIPAFAGFGFVISFFALGTGLFFFFRKRGGVG